MNDWALCHGWKGFDKDICICPDYVPCELGDWLSYKNVALWHASEDCRMYSWQHPAKHAFEILWQGYLFQQVFSELLEFLTPNVFGTQRQSTDFWLHLFTGWHNIVATAPLVMANAANLTEFGSNHGSHLSFRTLEIGALHPIARWKKFKTLRTCSSQHTYCAMSPKLSWFAIDSFIWFPKFSKATKLQNQAWAAFASVFRERHLRHFPLPFLFFFLQGGRADSSGSSSPTFSGLASQTERLQVLQETHLEGHPIFLFETFTVKISRTWIQFFAMCQWSTANFNA